MGGGEILILFVVLAAIVAAAVYGAIQAKKRREGMAALAVRLGLRFNPERDHDLARRFLFLDRLAQGSNRYAFNILSGTYRDQKVMAFDYHYETHSTDSKGRRQTHHHHFSFFILMLPRNFPEVTITREGLLSKLAQAIGFDDIDFESHEFSKKFCVRSKDKRFAYDVCNPQMIEYLLANGDLNIEIESDAVALGFGSRLDPVEIERNLGRLCEIRSRLPAYLFVRA